MTQEPPRPRRLVASPVFVLSAVRSGSTLLRAMLDSHPQLCAPHELHLKDVDVRLSGDFAERSMRQLGLAPDALRCLLWDRLMHHVLDASGKRVFVNKTPTDVFVWREIHACWPDARYVFLLRHPGAIAASWHRTQVHWTYDEAVLDVLRYVNAVEDARRRLKGLTVRYEDLTHDPAQQTRRVCSYLNVPWEPGMIEYGNGRRAADFQAGLGDWGERINSGRPRPARPAPPEAEIPPALREATRTWGYT